ncbi:MAG: hypothetical protein EAZ79_12010 [Oscillatoriales cyanobacterium]|nr:MAG: hypothetical protein EAZ79_12010 [Oscillatoriales cyanobacterium]
MPESVGCSQVFRKKPGFWGLARFLGPGLPPKKPGFCPNLWVVAKYFGKNPVSGAPRSVFFVDGRSGFWVDGRSNLIC